MEDTLIDSIRRSLAFGDDDEVVLTAVGEALAPSFDEIVDRFYLRLNQDATAAAILSESGLPMAEFKRALRKWMVGLFVGPYDRSYFERVSRIGQAHVRARLPQHYMVTAMNTVRSELTAAVARREWPDGAAVVLAMNKVLDLNLAVMLGSYQEDYAVRLRETERRSLEHRLQEVSHLANVGELAASLAHEIKNPLAGISGAIQVIGSALERDDPRRDIISEILSQIDRLDRTVRDLLVYARPKPPSLTPKDLALVVQRTLRFLRQGASLHDVPIRCQAPEQAVTAQVDEPQIEQVISNLLLNSVHACAQGGEITVSLTADHDHVGIAVADTGQGMTRDSLERAFEPFFTTKSRGTGLGLAICKRIVEAHRGRITIDSVEGQGTRVSVVLPR